MSKSDQAFRQAVAMKIFTPLTSNQQIAATVGRDSATVRRWFRDLRQLVQSGEKKPPVEKG